MGTDAARGAPERPPAPPTSARAAPVASTSDPHPEVGTRDAVETMTFPAFPHEPYGIQLELMRSLYATLRRGGIGVFESPTGTGKTLSVLCSALQWLEDERKANARGDTNNNDNSNDAAACDDEPDWLRDFASNKRGRDASDRETRRRARREEARRRAAEADRVFFASRGLNASERGAFGGGGRLQKSSTKSKAAAEAAAVAAYAAAVSRGASRDDAIEEAEFLADDWSDETGLANSKAKDLKYLRGDDTSSDEDADAKKTNAKRFRRGAPLGSSKTAVDDSEDSEDDTPSQQIIFCSRTHSQLTQVVSELRSTAFGKPAGLGEEDRLVSAVAVAGRRQLCVNRDALETAGASASRLNERCLELAEEGRKAGGGKKAKDAKGTDEGADKKQKGVAEKGCPFLRKRRAAVSELAEEALATPMDIEDLAAAGVKRKACPYYAAREAHKRADLIFAPYASLLHAETRESLGIRLSNAVVVFDEAHNLAEAVHGAYGASITGKQIDAVFRMVNAYVERFYSRLSPSNLRHLKTLKALCAAFGKALEDDKRDTSNDKTTPTVVKTLNDFLFDAGADAVNVFALTKYLKESKIAHKIAGYGERARANTSASLSDGASQKNASAREENASKWDWSDDDADVDLGVAAVVRRDTNATRHNGTHQKTPRVGSVHALAAFVSALAAADADGRVLVEKKEKNALDLNLDSARSPGGRLKFVLLDAAARFRAVVDQARAVVLVGGTLSPIDELAAQLFPDCAPVRGGSADADTSGYPVAKTSAEPSPSEAENDRNALRAPTRPTFDGRKPLFSLSVGHVVPRDALLPLAVGTGPSGLTLDFSFGKRDDEKMIDELGRIVCNACAVTPGGAVVFFPSFAYADKVYTRWTHTGLLQRIARLKTVFREPRNAADVETALRSFSDAVARFSVGSDVVSSSVSTAVHNKPSQTGALMLCVCGGKLSEGINFKDALGRLVVMVGLPYANPEEPELKARVAYLDEREGAFFHDAHKNKLNERAKTKTRGRRYYEALCMRSVNQSVGRAIRHVGDYAAILLCDRRYVTAPEVSTSFQTTNEGEREQVEKKNLRGVPAQLAGWIGERLVTPSGYGQTQASLARFFAGKRKNLAQ
jgi:chromosome transmission fidelity protein 1